MSYENKEIKINMDNLTAEERETLIKLVEKANKLKSRVWAPKDGEKYWFITTTDGIDDAYAGNIISNQRWLIGNCFPTKEAAQEEVTRREMLTRWKRLSIEAGEEENPWDEISDHWFVFYDCGMQSLMHSTYCIVRTGDIFFPTKESLTAAIAELGEENVKKYILGVET